MKQSNFLKMLSLFLVAIATAVSVASCSSSHGKDADNKTTKQVTAVVDSLIALEPDMTLTSLEVITAPMPSLMADEVKPAVNQSAEMLAAYIFTQALGGKSSKDESKTTESLIAMGAPIREAMKKYESESHPEYIFGLAELANNQDSTKNERRIYIFEEDNLKTVKRTEKFPKKKIKDFALLFALAFGDEIDFTKKDLKPADVKSVNDNQILKFIVSE